MGLFHKRTHEDDVREMKKQIEKAEKKYTAAERKELVPKLMLLRADWADKISDDLLDMLDDTIARWDKGEK